MEPSIDGLIDHIAKGKTDGPYISLTNSFGIACNYAISEETNEKNPAYVYEIEFRNEKELEKDNVRLIDPNIHNSPQQLVTN